MSSWKDMPCAKCLVPYSQCGHWPGHPKPKPSSEELDKLYRAWAKPAKPKDDTETLYGHTITTETRNVDNTRVKIIVPASVREFFQECGKKGGRSRSLQKKLAAQANGRLSRGPGRERNAGSKGSKRRADK